MLVLVLVVLLVVMVVGLKCVCVCALARVLARPSVCAFGFKMHSHSQKCEHVWSTRVSSLPPFGNLAPFLEQRADILVP